MGGACSLGLKPRKEGDNRLSETTANRNNSKKNTKESCGGFKWLSGSLQEKGQDQQMIVKNTNNKDFSFEKNLLEHEAGCNFERQFQIGRFFLQEWLSKQAVKGEKKWLQFVKEGREIIRKRKNYHGNDEVQLSGITAISEPYIAANVQQGKMKQLNEYLMKGWVQQSDRWSAWRVKMEVRKYFKIDLYEFLVNQECKCLKDIGKDIGRTFPEEDYFYFDESRVNRDYLLQKQTKQEKITKSAIKHSARTEQNQLKLVDRKAHSFNGQKELAQINQEKDKENQCPSMSGKKSYRKQQATQENQRNIEFQRENHTLNLNRSYLSQISYDYEKNKKGKSSFESGNEKQISEKNWDNNQRNQCDQLMKDKSCNKKIDLSNKANSEIGKKYESFDSCHSIQNLTKQNEYCQHEAITNDQPSRSIGQESLHRVLKALAAYFPHFKYTQGMNFIIGFFLLLNGGNEEEAFWMFVALAMNEQFLIMGLFENGFPLIDITKFIFEEKLKEYIPDLYHNIRFELDVKYEEWFFQWTIAVFLDKFGLKQAVRFWDYIISEGNFFAVVQISIAFLKEVKTEIIGVDHGQFQVFFSNLRDKHFYLWDESHPRCLNINKIIESAKKVKITVTEISHLVQNYLTSKSEIITNRKRINIYSSHFSLFTDPQRQMILQENLKEIIQEHEKLHDLMLEERQKINFNPEDENLNQKQENTFPQQSEEIKDKQVIQHPQIDQKIAELQSLFNITQHKDYQRNNLLLKISSNKAYLPPIKQGRKGSNHMHIPDESNEPAKNKLKAIKQTDKSSPHREDNNPNEDSSFKGLDKNQSRLPPLNIIYNPINPKKIQESNLQQENYGNVLVTNIDNESNQTPMVDHKARNWRQQDFFNDSKDTHHASKQLFNQPHKVKKKIQRANSSSFQSNQERSTSVYKKTKLLLNLSNFPKGHEQTNGNNAQDIFKKSSQISNELIQTNQQSSKISNLGIQSLRKPTHDTIISQKQPSPKEVMSEKDVTQQILRHPNSSSSSSSSSTSSLVVLKKQNIPQELNIHKQTPKLKQEKAAPDQIQKTKEIEDDDFNFVQGGMKITESQRYSLSSSRRRQSVNSQGKEQSHTKKTSSLLIIQGTPQQQQQLDSQHIPSYAASGEIKSKLFSSVQSQRTPLQHYFPNEEMANKPFGQLSPEIDKAQTYLNRVLSSQLLSEDSQQQQHSGSSSRNKNKFIKLKQSYNPHFHRSQIYQSNRSIHMQDTGNNTQKDLERYVVVVKDIQKNDEQLDNQNKLQFNTQQQPASLRTEVTIVQNNQYNENNNQASSDVRTLKQNDIEETNENHLGNYVIEQNVSLVKQTDQQVQPAGLQQTQTELQSQNDNHSINLERHDVEDYQENQFNTISSSVKPAAAVMSLEAEKLAEEIAQAHEISQIKMKDSSDESESQSQNENEIHKINHGNQNDPSSVGNTQREIEASERQPGRQSLVPRQREDTNLSGYITNLHPHNISGFSEQVNSISAVQLGQIQQTKKDLSMLQIHSPAHSTHRRSSQDQDKEREKQQQQQQDEQDIPERIEDKQSKGEDYSVTQNKIHNRCDNGGDDSMNKNTHNPLEQSPMIIFDESVNSISASTARCPPLPQFTPQTDRRQQQVTKTIPQVGNGSNKNDRNKNTKSNSLRLIGTSVVQNSFSQQKTIPALGQQQQQQQLKNNSSTPIRNSENLERNQFSDILDQQGQSQPGNDKVNNFVHSGQNVLGLFAQSAAHLQQIEEEMCTTEQLTSQYPGGLSPQRRRSTLNNRNNNNKSIDLKGKIDRLNESSHRIEVQNNNTLNQQNQPLEFQDQSLNRLNSSNLSSRTNQSWHSRYSGISKDNGQDKNPQTEHQANNNNNKPLSYHRTFGKHRIIGSTTAHTNILNSSLNNNSISNTQKTANMILNNEQKQMIISEYPPNNNQTLPMISPSSRQQHKSSASSDLIGIKEAIQAESGIDKQSHTGTSKLIPINLPLQQVVL